MTPTCCDKPMEPIPQMREPGVPMFIVRYEKGVPIYECKKCGRCVWSEDAEGKR